MKVVIGGKYYNGLKSVCCGKLEDGSQCGADVENKEVYGISSIFDSGATLHHRTYGTEVEGETHAPILCEACKERIYLQFIEPNLVGHVVGDISKFDYIAASLAEEYGEEGVSKEEIKKAVNDEIEDLPVEKKKRYNISAIINFILK